MSIIGKRIKRFREHNGMTQKELGELLGVTKSAINKMENAKDIDLRASTIKALCSVFDVYPRTFVYEDENLVISLLTEYYEEATKSKPGELTRFERVMAAVRDDEQAANRKLGPELMRITDIILTLNGKGVERILQYANDLKEIERYKRNPEA